MSFFINLDEPIIKRRIYDWFVRCSKNQICGEVETFGLNFRSHVCGYIIAYMDGLVIAKIQCRYYALILGNVNPKYADRGQIYLSYLKTKKINASFVV